MGKMKRKCNKTCCDYRKKIRKPIHVVGEIMPRGFTDEYFVETFKWLYPNIWDDLDKQYRYWNNIGQKFDNPCKFVLNASKFCRKELRNISSEDSMDINQVEKKKYDIHEKNLRKLEKRQEKVERNLHYIQEIEPVFAEAFIREYFKTHDLHERLEIIRELSKFKSDKIISFFYKVNACTRNFSLKKEAMRYIQGLYLPFYLRGKKQGKKSFIDNEIVCNESSPEILMKRLRIDRLERLKKFDMFISHNSLNEEDVAQFYKALNNRGMVAYVDWVNDKFDLKRQWCNATTAEIIKERIKQSRFFVIYATENVLQSQWCSWEIGYAEALGKKICIYLNGIELKNLPQFCWSYPILNISKNVVITKEEKEIELKQWIEEK